MARYQGGGVKSFTSLQGIGSDELRALVQSACQFAETKPAPRVLAGRAVATLFFERSTRTRLSFELATQRLGGDVLSFDPSTASTGKGESLRDTVRTIATIGADILVVRHAEPGVPDQVAEWTGVPVVNAGDGTREHPTQALVDAVTLVRHFGDPSGLRMGIVGDIRHSRVAGSLFHAMPALGVDLTLIGPPELLPAETHGIATSTSLDPVIGDLDVVYLLRVQTERGASVGDRYTKRFQLDAARASRLVETAVVMHPGPLNRGVEVTDDVADGPRSLILQQVANGVPSRMAVLAALESSLT